MCWVLLQREHNFLNYYFVNSIFLKVIFYLRFALFNIFYFETKNKIRSILLIINDLVFTFCLNYAVFMMKVTDTNDSNPFILLEKMC